MADPSSILLMTRNPATTQAAAVALNGGGRFRLAGVCGGIMELPDRLQECQAACVLVDVGSDGTLTLQRLDGIIRRFPQVRFIVLADAFRPDTALEAMQIGARHYITRDRITEDLVFALERLLPDRVAEGDHHGRLITVLSAGGGCGATMLACNIAHEAGLQLDETALLVDLDWAYGSGAAYLGVKGQYSVADVLEHAGGMDGHLIRSTAVAGDGPLHVLLSPATVDMGHERQLSPESVEPLMMACRSAFGCVVVDAPRAPSRLAAALARASDKTLIVLQLTVKDVQVARGILAAMERYGAPASQVRFVVNRYRAWSNLTLDEARQALGDRVLFSVRNDFKVATRSINYGQLLERSAPASKLRRDVRELAQRLGFSHHIEEARRVS